MNDVCLRFNDLLDNQIQIQLQYKNFQVNLGLDFIDYIPMLMRMKEEAIDCLDKVLINIPPGAVCS